MLRTILLLTASNIFMTFAWYGNLKNTALPLWKAILISWGDRIVRIYVDGTRQPPRICKWLYGFPVKNHTGSDHPGCICGICHLVPERAISLEIHGEFCTDTRGRVFCFQKIMLNYNRFI